MGTTYDRLFIGGRWVAPAGTGTIEVVNPATEAVVGTVPEGTAADMDSAVTAARAAVDSGIWSSAEPAERAQVLARVAAAIRDEAQPLAELITAEVGSPIAWSSLAQVMVPAMVFDYYAGLGATVAFEDVRPGMLGRTLVRREPVGVVAAITAWNVPLFLAAAKLAPALLAGCAVVLKPAPETPLDALRLAEILADAGLPEGVLSVIPAGRDVGEHLVRHRGVDKVTFTGSTAAGRTIGAICGEQLKRCSLELGGKSAAVLLDDVDLGAALPMLLPNAMMNNGEACIAQTRVLAPRSRYQEVVDALVEAVRALPVGDPLDPATAVGPLVARRQQDRVEGYIRIGQEEGAKIALGGGRPAGTDRGFFVEPTVFVDVDNAMRIAREEIFGPVLAVIAYDGDDEAVAIANDSDYGLCGSVWTADHDRGLGVARRVRTGSYMLNSPVPLDPATPFGGFKASGVGRELGEEGLELFLEKKSISLPAGYEPAT